MYLQETMIIIQILCVWFSLGVLNILFLFLGLYLLLRLAFEKVDQRIKEVERRTERGIVDESEPDLCAVKLPLIFLILVYLSHGVVHERHQEADQDGDVDDLVSPPKSQCSGPRKSIMTAKIFWVARIKYTPESSFEGSI